MEYFFTVRFIVVYCLETNTRCVMSHTFLELSSPPPPHPFDSPVNKDLQNPWKSKANVNLASVSSQTTSEATDVVS